MASVVLLEPDLMFGTRLQEALTGAGHRVALCSAEADARTLAREADVLVVDAGSSDVDGAGLVESMLAAAELEGTRTIGFYPHVDAEAGRRAREAGLDLVVPRSRMAREGGVLVDRVMASEAAG